MKLFLRRYWVTLLVLSLALLLSVQSAMAADNGTTSISETVQSFLGGLIAATIINIFTQRRAHRVETKANSAVAQVKTLSRELGVDDPQKATPDITIMETKVAKLEIDLVTVKNELVTTLEERDTARTAAAKQVEKNAEDNQSAQTQIDKLTRDLSDERAISARLDQQLAEYDKRFNEQALQMARIEGRLDQQAIQDSLGNTLQTAAKLLNDVAARLVPAQTEAVSQ